MGGEVLVEVSMSTKREEAEISAISAQPPDLQLHNPPLLDLVPKIPEISPFASRLMMSSPIVCPIKKAIIISMQSYSLQEEAHVDGRFMTKLDQQDAWLPITESRNGNAYYSAFHTLCSGIGFQALVLPLAFTSLGWTWGTLGLSLVFIWQMYTLLLLIKLHESESGTRYSRYLRLSMLAFGEKWGKLLALFPTMYLSGGTCVTLIMIGGGTMKIFFQIICGDTCNIYQPTTTEWYVVFTCFATVLAQFPNLNSIASWVCVFKSRPLGISYDPLTAKYFDAKRIFTIFNAFGIIAFTFRGHNLVLEIQGTMPSNAKCPSRVPMWRGVKFAYAIIAMCLFPIAIGGYWAYGNLIPNGGMLNALYKYHADDTPRWLLGLTSLLVVINSLSSFQIYAMPVFDNLELRYTSKANKPCPWWLRSGFRAAFGCLAFFIAVALPFLPSLAGLIGGISLPITLAYPCFMWILIKKPQKCTGIWYLNSVLGVLGMILSILVVTAAIRNIVTIGIEIHFFKPK
ncbi:hypothetical protein I3843_07G139000 [Carya illinoinensis]|nr:hypothetical protein I3843_07G139000 [Carya illinoinensis]